MAAPSAVLASHRFDDIPDGGLHAPVKTITEAGIVRGCGDAANYCPDRNLTRGEMAQFLSRALPSVSQTTFDTSLGTADTAVATIEVSVPGRDGGEQNVRLDANVELGQGTAACVTCSASFRLEGDGDPSPDRSIVITDGTKYRTITAVIPVPTGTTQTFTLYGEASGISTGTFDVSGELTAETIALGN